MATLKEGLDALMMECVSIHSIWATHCAAIRKSIVLNFKHVPVWLLKNIVCKKVPKFHASFENFVTRLLILLLNPLTLRWHQISALNDILQACIRAMFEELNILIRLHRVARLLNQSHVLLKNRWNREANLFAKVLKIALMLRVVKSLKLFPKIPVFSHNLNLLDEMAVVEARLLLVHVLKLFFLVVKWHLRNLSKQFYCLNSCTAGLDQISQNFFNQFCLKNVSEWDPWQERLKCLEALSNEARLNCLWSLDSLSNYKLTKLEDRLKVIGQNFLKLRSLSLQKRVFAKVKHLLTKQLENIESIFALGLRLASCLANIRDEVLPGYEPLLLNNWDQCDIQFGNQMLLVLLMFILRHLQYQLDNALSDTLLLLVGQHLPPSLNRTKNR